MGYDSPHPTETRREFNDHPMGTYGDSEYITRDFLCYNTPSLMSIFPLCSAYVMEDSYGFIRVRCFSLFYSVVYDEHLVKGQTAGSFLWFRSYSRD